MTFKTKTVSIHKVKQTKIILQTHLSKQPASKPNNVGEKTTTEAGPQTGHGQGVQGAVLVPGPAARRAVVRRGRASVRRGPIGRRLVAGHGEGEDRAGAQQLFCGRHQLNCDLAHARSC